MISDGFDGLMCDLDGVLYRGNDPIPGAIEAVKRLRDDGIKVVFCTNNSRSTVAQYVERLTGMGVEAGPDEIVTSAIVTGEVLASRGVAGKRAVVVGGDGVREAVAAAGAIVDDDWDGDGADLVVVGWDKAFTFEKMKRAAVAVRDGAEFVATNSDASFPAPGGKQWPGAGAILASIEVAAGAKAEIMGKPHPPMMEVVARRLAGSRSIAAVGDRSDTDIAGGRARGWFTILVLSGVTSAEEARRLDPAPDRVVASIADLVR